METLTEFFRRSRPSTVRCRRCASSRASEQVFASIRPVKWSPQTTHSRSAMGALQVFRCLRPVHTANGIGLGHWVGGDWSSIRAPRAWDRPRSKVLTRARQWWDRVAVSGRVRSTPPPRGRGRCASSTPWSMRPRTGSEPSLVAPMSLAALLWRVMTGTRQWTAGSGPLWSRRGISP